MAMPTLSHDIDFHAVPAFALNVSSRMKLSWFLNPEQSLRSNQGIARDYRGLAEQMGFQYNDIKNFQRSEDPTAKILEAWTVTPNNTVGHILSYLENMDRYDVIEDTVQQFKADAASYLKTSTKSSEVPIQVAEITSGPPSAFQTESLNALTVTDVQTGGPSYYDAYVCYADEDIDFVQRLAKFLEDNGLILFIKGRDLLAGTSEPDAHTKLLEERCNFVLIILSPAFLRSPECEWQISFAAGLAVEHRKRKLIPLLKSPCEIPSFLKYVSKIDFTKPDQDWLMYKLVQSLRATKKSIFVSSHVNMCARRQPELALPSDSNPIISFPPSTSFAPISSSSTSSMEITSAPISTNVTSAAITQAITIKTSNTKTQTKQKWYKQLFSHSSSGTHPSSTSTATSGFHSHSGFESENSSDYKKFDAIEDTI